MAERIDVFISSTSRDLTDFRDAVAKVILRLGMFPIDMANFNVTGPNALQLFYDKMQEAEIFIGIYAHRYGYAPDESVIYTTIDGKIRTGDGTTSITHWEYQWAIESNLPMLLFVVDEDVAWQPKYIDNEPAKSRLKAFKADVDKNYVRGMFSTSDNLATQIATALAELKANLYTRTPITIKKRHDFYKHVHLPTNYISRHDLLAELRLVLLGDDNIALTSAIKGATALHGMGGIGKRVLARALLEVVGDAYPRAAILHDLLRDFMAVELDDPQTAHQALLDAYAETQTADGWHTAPDDGYLYLNIAYHLKELGQLETIKALLLNYDWLQAKLDATDTNALIADCDCVPDDETIRLIKSLFGMSQHIFSDLDNCHRIINIEYTITS